MLNIQKSVLKGDLTQLIWIVAKHSYGLLQSGLDSRFQYASNLKSQSISTMADSPEKNEVDLEVGQPSLTTSLNSGEDDTTKAAESTQPAGDPPLSKRQQKKAIRAQKFKELKKQRKAENLRVAQKEDAGFNTEDFNESEYYIDNGLRKVYPYHYVFATYAKGRWIKKKLKDILSGEFGFDHPEELTNAFAQGRIHVNNVRAKEDHVVKDQDYISHRIHRHENPVTCDPIEIIEDTESVLVVNKPSSIPCHPCGRYRFNSLVFILGKVFGYTNLRNIYRLDRLTSGVLILGKTPEKSKKLEDQVFNRQVQKEYVCRVIGEFPEGEQIVDQPLAAIFNKMRLQVVSPKGKPSVTHFQRMSYNGTSSVVKCFPKTGRTHQIRVHLQYLGHPIINDNFYNSDAWGPSRGKGGDYGVSHDQVCDRILTEHVATMWEEGENPLYTEKFGARGENVDSCTSSSNSSHIAANNGVSPESEEPPTKCAKLSSDLENGALDTANLEPESTEQQISTPKSLSDNPLFDKSKWTIVEGCDSCKKTFSDPTRKQLVMFLHALKYKGPDWQYETALPDWAKSDWNKEEEFSL